MNIISIIIFMISNILIFHLYQFIHFCSGVYSYSNYLLSGPMKVLDTSYPYFFSTNYLVLVPILSPT